MAWWAKDHHCQCRAGAEQAGLQQAKGQGWERVDNQGEGVDLLQIYFRPTHPGRAKDISLAANTRFPSWIRSQMWGGELEEKEKGRTEECWQKQLGKEWRYAFGSLHAISRLGVFPNWPRGRRSGVCVCVFFVTLPSFQETKPVRTREEGIQALRAEIGAELRFQGEPPSPSLFSNSGALGFIVYIRCVNNFR